MDFIVGSVTALMCVAIAFKFINNNPMNTKKPLKLSLTQSEQFLVIKPALDLMKYVNVPEMKETQATKFFDSRHTTVAIAENKAYWIENNALFFTEVIDGDFEKEDAKRVDTMGMSDVELNKIIYIVEQLSEGRNNDSGYTWKPKF